MAQFFLVITTFPDRKSAEKICKILINENLAACCQITSSITSIYWWNKKIERSKEYLCLIKTEKSVLEDVKKKIISNHPYEVPEIMCFKADDIDKKYAKWIKQTIKKRG